MTADETATRAHAALARLGQLADDMDSLADDLEWLAQWADDSDHPTARALAVAAVAAHVVSCAGCSREPLRDLAVSLPLPGLEYQP